MRRTLSLALFISILLANLPALQGASTPVRRDQLAITIVRQTVAAMAETGALLAYQDSVATGTLTVFRTTGPLTYPASLKTKGGAKTRFEFQSPDGRTSRILNQGQGVVIGPDGVVRRLASSNTVEERVTHIPVLSIVSEAQNDNVVLRYVGVADVDGSQADVIMVSLIPEDDDTRAEAATPRGSRTKLFVDQTSKMIVKVQYVLHSEERSSDVQLVETVFRDYRSVGGLSVPFRQTTIVDGAICDDLTLTDLSVNVGVNDSEFALPEVGNAR